MTERRAILLGHRGVLAIDGEDRRTFLQGLVSNDVDRAGPSRAIWSAFLTPQGKFLHEFFLIEKDDRLLLDCEAERMEEFRKKLSLYKLRAKVAVAPDEGCAVYALTGPGAAEAFGIAAEPGAATGFGGGVVFVDPRLAEAGLRAILPATGAEEALIGAGFEMGTEADWDRHRLALGLPDGSRDLAVDKAILLENGFDELHGVDWDKGCYMGQELTARTRYRGLVKKRLLPVVADGAAPEAGEPLMLGEVEAGEMRSSCGDRGLALIRLEHLERAEKEGLTAGAKRVVPHRPDWLRLQEKG